MKTLVFGNAAVGKTSLLKSTCEGYTFLQLINIPPTRGISRENYLFRGLLEINAWDSGGQDKYLKRYFSENQRESLFSEVSIPIFMEDCSELHPEQAKLFKQFVENIVELSPQVKRIYVLMNKTDVEGADPNKLFELLRLEIDPKYLHLLEFTPVSVKHGTAQHRLIEILDNALENSVLELQKRKNIREMLESIKADINCELILLNRPDGLITTSTLGDIPADPLKYIPLDIALMESNIDSIFESIQEAFQQSKQEHMYLDSYIFTTETRFIILKEINDYGMLIVISPDKNNNIFPTLFGSSQVVSDKLKELEEMIKHR
ncbi:hypothetical protein NEF87_002899 [Candidatus Lokiarchaeum ossiferum]|uniref:Uncharacterized protein n=1 Tax=Candidatus Lokiarchaeum ossiferum TaxID=2951803 RepID=A0ABY6HSY4_9ARCH|nr:hypothetical protein NEF87_002899 [Candidatus Lokiarchaeum sp. B-35]